MTEIDSLAFLPVPREREREREHQYSGFWLVHHVQKNTQSDPLGYLKRAGVLWDRRVRKSLNAMCTELKVPLHGQPRISADREDFVAKWNELSNYNMGKKVFLIPVLCKLGSNH